MRKEIRRYFNMVEIALALAVVGIGIAGVMSLFPIGFNSIRDAMAESYGTDVAEEFMTQISRLCKDNWDTLVWNDIGFSDRDIIPDQKGGDGTAWNAPSGGNSDVDADNGNLTWLDDDTDALFGNIYFNDQDNNNDTLDFNSDNFRVFRILRKSGDIVDFEAAMRIWKRPITNLNVAGQEVDFSTAKDAANNSIEYKYGMILYAEISWPMSKPYDKREKRIYCKEIFRAM